MKSLFKHYKLHSWTLTVIEIPQGKILLLDKSKDKKAYSGIGIGSCSEVRKLNNKLTNVHKCVHMYTPVYILTTLHISWSQKECIAVG